MKKLQLLFLALLTFLLLACSTGNSTAQNSTAVPVPVNGFGTAANHVHSLVILPDANATMLLATHYGIFRSQNHGVTWQETAGGPGQPMQGFMTYNLSYNLIDPQRIYVLTYIQGAGVPDGKRLGLYTSGDSGKTWQLSSTDSSVTSSTIFFAQAGNETASEVYIYLRERGPLGLLVSKDNGQHFTSVGGSLPFGTLLGLQALPGEPGHLLAYGDEGIARTTDGGLHWQVVKGVNGGIFEITTPGSKKPIYAEGDAGVYVSHDDGESYTLVHAQQSYSSLSASSQNPLVIYGKSGLQTYRSTDGGHNWSALPAINGSLQVLVVDPANAEQVYLALNYPTEVYHFSDTSNSWQSLTPPV